MEERVAQKGLRSQFLISGIALSTLTLSLGVFAIYSLNQISSLPLEQIHSQKSFYLVVVSLLTCLGFATSLATTWYLRRRISSQLGVLIQKVSESATIVAKASDSILENSHSLSHKAAIQAGTLQATSASIEKIDRTIQENAKGARTSAEVSITNYQTATNGKKSVETMVQAISEIRDSNVRIAHAVEESNQQFVQIVEAINMIAEKTKVINDIVFQTKILSFNASVEAARAGIHGRGFSVVAQEVGNLAVLSGKAAEGITDLLERSNTRVREVVEQTRVQVTGLVADADRKISVGSNIANECDYALAKIVQDSTELRQLLAQITSTCDDQAVNAKKVTESMLQLDIAVVDNFHDVKTAERTASNLNQQANDLRRVVNHLLFALGENSQKSSRLSQRYDKQPLKRAA